MGASPSLIPDSIYGHKKCRKNANSAPEKRMRRECGKEKVTKHTKNKQKTLFYLEDTLKPARCRGVHTKYNVCYNTQQKETDGADLDWYLCEVP